MATPPCFICLEELRLWEGRYIPCCSLRVYEGSCFENLIRTPVPGGSGRLLGDTCPQCRAPRETEGQFSRVQARVERSGGDGETH